MKPKTRGRYGRGYHTKLHYHITGQGEPLILLHGNSQDLHFFDAQVAYFKDYYQVISIDSPGHGKSSWGKNKLTIGDMSNEITHLLHRLKIEKAYFIGFSDGGNIALKIALHSPELVGAMTIIGANIHPKGIKAIFRIPIIVLYRLLKLLPFIPKLERRSQIVALMATGPDFSIEKLKACRIPILLLAGERDIIEEKHSKEMARLLPNAKMRILKDAGHFLLRQKKEEVHSLMLEFFQNHSSKAIAIKAMNLKARSSP
jgi:pimeloyl-ACP methyl ester carboxylesterase